MNNIRYEMYDTINENIQINKLKDFLLQLHDVCNDNTEIATNSSWKAKAKDYYNEYIDNINDEVIKLDNDVQNLNKTITLIEEINNIIFQIKEIEQRMTSMIESQNIPLLQEQIDELSEEKRRKESELLSLWNV